MATRSGKNKHSKARLWGAVCCALLAGCGDSAENLLRQQLPLEDFTAEQIYQRGEYELAQGDELEAAFYFAEVERLYPYSAFTQQSLLMQAFAYHRARDYNSSRAAAQRFLDFYPAAAQAAYVQYLLALSYYDQIDEVGRDQMLTIAALQEFRKLIETYPESDYTQTAKLKFDLAYDHLAGKEMEVGRYYLKRDNFNAAISRFRLVVEEFDTTSHVPEALYRLVEAYLSLGLAEEAQTAGAILGHNFRASTWYADGYHLLTGKGLQPQARGRGWLARVYRQTIKGEWL